MVTFLLFMTNRINPKNIILRGSRLLVMNICGILVWSTLGVPEQRSLIKKEMDRELNKLTFFKSFYYSIKFSPKVD
jgi:hypothetical protein